ncbi:MAG TPA: hypothetical protein VJ859_16465, partial [Allosphingosinicella sp.]|nr:hypothetical protein [Allosphingosinicella sp.]
ELAAVPPARLPIAGGNRHLLIPAARNAPGPKLAGPASDPSTAIKELSGLVPVRVEWSAFSPVCGYARARMRRSEVK